ncbi:MAG: hypothetical protein AB7K09_17485 [Planctomycetota bacterium]
MHALRLSWMTIVVLFTVVAATLAGAAGSAAAGELPTPFDLPDFRADDSPVQMSTTTAPWLSQEERYYHADANVFWNMNYRGGIGQVKFTGFEYSKYNYNNKSDANDLGSIEETHHMATLIGAPIPNLRLFVSFGISTVGIFSTAANRGTHALTGLVYELGTDVGFPIGPVTIMGRFYWRQWEATRKGVVNALATQWNGAILVAVEPVGSRDGISLNIYAGVGYHYNFQDWDFTQNGESVFEITPDNSSSQTNGTDKIDVIAGLNLLPLEWLSFNFEARFVGPLYLIGSLSVIF